MELNPWVRYEARPFVFFEEDRAWPHQGPPEYLRFLFFFKYKGQDPHNRAFVCPLKFMQETIIIIMVIIMVIIVRESVWERPLYMLNFGKSSDTVLFSIPVLARELNALIIQSS